MEQLPQANYPSVLSSLKAVKINCLFARSVLEHRVEGAVYVDRAGNPGVYYVKHPYGMSLVFGERDAFARWDSFWKLPGSSSTIELKDEWLQIWPEPLAKEFERQSEARICEPGEDGLKIERHTRVNFQFKRALFSSSREALLEPGVSIVRIGKGEYDGITGSVIPRYFWSGRDAFLRAGVGFSIVDGGVAASTAFSAFIHDKQLELGIETRPEFQGKGYAFAVCRRLISCCLEMGYEPVWSCRLENVGSVKLAEKLGFKPSFFLPYFRIKTLGVTAPPPAEPRVGPQA
jgi:GNAT superfamily N-acetyltransferase